LPGSARRVTIQAGANALAAGERAFELWWTAATVSSAGHHIRDESRSCHSLPPYSQETAPFSLIPNNTLALCVLDKRGHHKCPASRNAK
jgi:hypothetical protein